MEKPILATNIDGLLIERAAFIEPHKAWFERVIKKTKDDSLRKWMGREDYFIGVNEAMEKILPNASKEERTRTAREWYQKDVISYIKSHQEVIKKDIAKKLVTLKEKYRLILITSNTKDYIDKIIKNANLKGIYDGIIASKTEKEPNKEELIEELMSKYDKPICYLTGKSEDKINTKFQKLDIKIISVEEISQLF